MALTSVEKRLISGGLGVELPNFLALIDALPYALASSTKAAYVAPLAQDISAAYVEAEVQAISTKVDAILTALVNAGLMNPS